MKSKRSMLFTVQALVFSLALALSACRGAAPATEVPPAEQTGSLPVLDWVTVKNSLFGPSVTVAGLLAGKDILNAIQGKRLGSLLLIPARSLKDDEGLFIDDVELSEVEAAAGIAVKKVSSFSDLVGLLKASGDRRVQRRGS